MEVVYFLISVIEIVLTFYLVFLIKKADIRVLTYEKIFNEKKESCISLFKKSAAFLKITSLLSKTYKKMEYFNKYLSKLLKIKSVLSVISSIRGKTKKGKFRIFPILRKILFFI